MKVVIESLERVLVRAGSHLEWGNPEQWIQTELFASLNDSTGSGHGWSPFKTEVPYVTRCPVKLPSAKSEYPVEGPMRAGVKWVDLWLSSAGGGAHCWVEIKVVSSAWRQDSTKQRAAALNAFRKDIAGLVEFDPVHTSSLWSHPLEWTQAYWMPMLSERADELVQGTHRCLAILVQLEGGLEGPSWTQGGIVAAVDDWLQWRKCPPTQGEGRPAVDVEVHRAVAGTKHDIAVASWRVASRTGCGGLSS